MLVFDEVAELLKGHTDADPYFVLRRTLAMLKDFSIWSFSLSTLSDSKFMPPFNGVEKSDRIIKQIEVLPEPFLALQLDVVASKALEADYRVELSKPMSHFATARHMAMFGRPLWRAYLDNPADLRRLARTKILCNRRFNTRDVNQMFAAMASRLCLDVVMEHREAFALSSEAVNSHLRIALTISPTSISTTTPSEPVVSEAVAELLCDGPHGSCWNDSISTLSAELLGSGLVSKGEKGELFARLLCILARDFYLAEAQKDSKFKDSLFPYAEPFSVQAFLESLLAPEFFKNAMDFKPNLSTVNTRSSSKSKETAPFNEVFAEGHLNFTHLTSTDRVLESTECRICCII